jgi:MFS family permease
MQHLRIKEFNIFLLVRFALVFGWSMQFIVIEWKVYELTGDPLYLGLIGLMEIIPALSMALFAGHIVDQKEKRNLLALCIAAFSLISFWSFLGYVRSTKQYTFQTNNSIYNLRICFFWRFS